MREKRDFGLWLLTVFLTGLLLASLAVLAFSQDYQSLNTQSVVEDIPLWRANNTPVQEAAAQIIMTIVGIAAYLFERQTFWVASAVVGVLLGAVWNYAVTAVYTWKKPQAA